tara:strand:- start:2473 stop:2775 length:303 start_codon:yes stop_codon:yes gene_type:complete
MNEKEESLKLPHDSTLKNASKLSIQEDKPIMLDYWMDSCDINNAAVMIGVKTNEEKLLVRSSEEFTSPISKIYKVSEEYIIMTENSIYVVSSKIPTRRIS